MIQRPTPPNKWLTKLDDPTKEETRMFSDVIARPDTAPAWEECTDEFKRKWEEEHPQPQPPTPPSPIEERVVELIRQRYSINQELEARRLMDKVLAGTATDDERKFAEDFDAYVKWCQEQVKQQENA